MSTSTIPTDQLISHQLADSLSTVVVSPWLRTTSRSVPSGDVCELLRHLKLARRRRGCRAGRRSTRRGTSYSLLLFNITVVVGRRTHCRRVQSEVRPTVLVRPAVECSTVRSDSTLNHTNSKLIAGVSSSSLTQHPQYLPPEPHLTSTPKVSSSNVSYFRDDGPEEEHNAGESSTDSLMSQATTPSLTDADHHSPVLLMSPDSQPRSFLFDATGISDYCIAKLFNQSVAYQNNTVIEQNSSIVPSWSPPTARNFCSYFPRFWTCNVRGGMSSKIDEISEIIQMNAIDIAVLVETWLHAGMCDDLVAIGGYCTFRKDRNYGRCGGGVLVYVRNGLPCEPLSHLDKSGMEAIWLLYRRCIMPREVSHILIGSLYHPPKANNGKMLDYLISSLDTVSRQHPQVGIILLGDFNQLPDSQLRSYPMRQLVTGPTRKLATLDKIYTNISNWFEKPVILPGISRSDHDSVLMVPSHHIRFWYLRCCGCPGLRGMQHPATPHTRSPWIPV